MSESQVIGSEPVDGIEPTAAKRPIDKGFLRNVKVIGGAVAVVSVIVVFVAYKSIGSSGSKVNESVSVNTGIPVGQMKNGEDQTPAMQEKLRAQQLADAERARREGRSYIPEDPIGSVQPVTPAAERPSAPAPMPTESTMQVTMSNLATSSGYGGGQQDGNMRKALEAQMAMMFPTSVAEGGQARQSISRATTQAPASGSAASGAGQAQASAAGAASSGSAAPVIQALEIHTAKLANPITAIKGKQAYSSAIITSGPFAGAFLTGTSTLNDVENIETVYNMMRIGNKAYRVDAIVLDEQTADAGMRGDIDRRILQRYVLPISVALAQGYFTAAAQTGTQVVSGTGGVLASQTPAPTEEQALNAGRAAAMGIIQRDVQQAAQAPIRASVNRDMNIGILFRAPVKDEVK